MPSYEFEQEAMDRGYLAVCGIDEAGRGPLAGNVVAAAVILQKEEPQISAAAQNIYTILYPGLSMITFAFLGSHRKGETASCLPTLLYMMLFAMLIFFTDVALLVASIAGSVIVILSENAHLGINSGCTCRYQPLP